MKPLWVYVIPIIVFFFGEGVGVLFIPLEGHCIVSPFIFKNVNPFNRIASTFNHNHEVSLQNQVPLLLSIPIYAFSKKCTSECVFAQNLSGFRYIRAIKSKVLR